MALGVRAGVVIAVLVAGPGCAVQLDAGGHLNHARSEAPVTMGVSGRLIRPRGNGGYVAASATVSDASAAEPAAVRSVALGGGYRALLSGPVSLEVGFEVGGGQPAFGARDGTALYLGPVASALLRVLGHQDETPGFMVGDVLIDLVLTLRGGVWSASGLEDETWDASAHLGLRLSIVSDLVMSDPEGWEP